MRRLEGRSSRKKKGGRRGEGGLTWTFRTTGATGVA